jgi:hypothetical protein
MRRAARIEGGSINVDQVALMHELTAKLQAANRR